MENQNVKYVYVVLTFTGTILSMIIKRVTGKTYCHSSISLTPHLYPMFSFARKYTNNPFIGIYKREYLTEGLFAKCGTLPGKIIAIPVSPDQYSSIKRRLDVIWSDRHSYTYNVLGLLLNGLRVAYTRPKSYTCSQFVAETLDSAGVYEFNMPFSLVRPNDFERIGGIVLYEGDLKRYTPSVCYNFLES